MLKIMLVALAINIVFVVIRGNNLDTNESILETVGIALAILIAVVVSTISEQASNSAFEKLQRATQNIAVRVMRNGQTIEIPIEDVVVDDLILLSGGDKVPADGVIIDGQIEIDQSVINGESEPATKRVRDIALSGTVVTNGNATIRVTHVGDATFYGKMAGELKTTQPESPLKVKLSKLAKVISLIGYVGAGLVAIAYLFNVLVIMGHALTFTHIINTATLVVSVIVMAVPEGLPMMITVVLSSNVKNMMRDKVLVRKLNGIETAGSMNILFTDKTGTLTQGKLEVAEVITDNIEMLGTILRYNTGSQINPQTKGAIGGNFTDRILLEYAQRMPFERNQTVIEQIPFSSATKFMQTKLSDGRILLKGAPETIFKMCKGNHQKAKQRVLELTAKAYRVIACAVGDEYVGLVAIRDRVRPEAISAVKQLQSAGIQTVMITGDARETAVAVAREVGILSGNEIVLSSPELSAMDDKQLARILPNLRVVARALPTDKSRLVRVAQSIGLVVGMTGDGVNDAPALKAADVGFSMGSGTEVAKEAGDIVIINDNIASIARATSYGRTVFKSIRKFLIFKLTINFVAMGISILAPFMGVSVPITVLQMLWINIVMDTLAGLAYGGERPRASYMTEPPKRRNEPIINRYMWGQILYASVFISFLCFWFLMSPIIQGQFHPRGAIYTMTAFFAFFMFINIFNAFNSRTHDINPASFMSLNKPFIYIMGLVIAAQVLLIFFGGSVFRTAPIDFKHFAIIIILALTILPIDMLRKIFIRLRFGDRLTTT
jgi:calcium-translocating P-type ATPase